MDRFDEPSPNPYTPPQESENGAPAQVATALPDGRFWRMYLYAHLAFVACGAVFTFSETPAGQAWLAHGGVAESFMLVVAGLAMTGLLFLWAFPIVLIVLLLSSRRSWRYILIALVEGFLNFAWTVAILPAVQ